MKKFALVAAALATVFSTSAMAAPAFNGQNDRGSQHRVEQRNDGRSRDNRGQEARNDRNQQTASRHWKKGERFDSRQASNYRVIAQPKVYGLKAAPSGHRWVQSGNDAVLIGITSGLIAAVLGNVIR